MRVTPSISCVKTVHSNGWRELIHPNFIFSDVKNSRHCRESLGTNMQGDAPVATNVRTKVIMKRISIIVSDV
jgi:hypothetical protein